MATFEQKNPAVYSRIFFVVRVAESIMAVRDLKREGVRMPAGGEGRS